MNWSVILAMMVSVAERKSGVRRAVICSGMLGKKADLTQNPEGISKGCANSCWVLLTPADCPSASLVKAVHLGKVAMGAGSSTTQSGDGEVTVRFAGRGAAAAVAKVWRAPTLAAMGSDRQLRPPCDPHHREPQPHDRPAS